MEAPTPIRNKSSRTAFTLVELLTVIIIIGILAGLITAAAIPAIRRARATVIQSEIEQLAMALEKYKQERGDYPPDFAGVDGGADPVDTGVGSLSEKAQTTVLRHFRKAFPRYTPGKQYNYSGVIGSWDALLYDITQAAGTAITSADLNPATAIVLMLGGPPAPTGSSTKLLGFSANPANPFAVGGSRLPTLFEFDETRLQLHKNLFVFIPPHMPQPSSGNKAPYVYFRPRNRNYWRVAQTGLELPFFCQSLEQGICTPYADENTGNTDSDGNPIIRWMEPTKFQIICAGLDGLFGAPVTAYTNLPIQDASVEFDSTDMDNVRFLGVDDANISPEEDDNITSFTQGKLEDRAEE